MSDFCSLWSATPALSLEFKTFLSVSIYIEEDSLATGHLHQTNHVSDILSSLTTCKGNWCQYVLLKEEEAEIGLWSCCLLTQTVGHRFRYSYLMLGSGDCFLVFLLHVIPLLPIQLVLYRRPLHGHGMVYKCNFLHEKLDEPFTICSELRSEHKSRLVEVNYIFPLSFFVLERIKLLCPLWCTGTTEQSLFKAVQDSPNSWDNLPREGVCSLFWYWWIWS